MTYRLLFGLLLATACGRETTAPTSLTLQPVEPAGCICIGPPSASGQFAIVGQPVTITLKVADQNGNGVSGIGISWAVSQSNGLADVATSVTDSGGIARVSWMLDTIAKLDSLVASIASGSSMLVTATGRHAAATPATAMSGDSQVITAGTTSRPFVFRITARFSNSISGGAVAWSVVGGGSMSALTTTTDSAGMTSATLSTTAAPGVYRVIATYASIPAVIFTLTAK
jgi:hypothetical protein